MKVRSLTAKQFRSFIDTGKIELSDVNILIGANNSGKSSIIRALHQIQNGLNDLYADIRMDSHQSIIEIELSEVKNFHNISSSSSAIFTCELTSKDRRAGSYHSRLIINNEDILAPGEIKLPNIDPNHFIVPYLSKRKSGHYIEDVKEHYVYQITSDTTNLAAKLSRIANPSFPEYEEYARACKEILGFVVTSIPSQNGQRPGVYLPNQKAIFIDQMGEGVPNIVLLLVNIATSQEKLFLIEEPENDLHPRALKALLDLIISSSKRNQFVISTHSNIVISQLCTNTENKLFKISSNPGELPPIATIELIPPEPDSRIKVLQELGYAFSDYDMWDGWLLLEESSAEKIIRDYLIPWFVPTLTRIKTVSAGGVSNVEPAFTDLHRLMLFIHLQPAYTGKAWVRIDGDAPGQQAIEKLRKKFPSIKTENFATFDKPQFEYYYPSQFSEKVEKALKTEGKYRREAKKELLVELIQWLDSDIERGKTSLKNSAASVILELEKIADQFKI